MVTPDIAYTRDGDPDDAYAPGDVSLDDLDPAELDRLAVEMEVVVDKASALAFYDRLAGHG